MLCIFIQFRKKLVFSMVSAICKFGITYILPNNSWIFRCFRSVKLVVYSFHAQCMQRDRCRRDDIYIGMLLLFLRDGSIYDSI